MLQIVSAEYLNAPRKSTVHGMSLKKGVGDGDVRGFNGLYGSVGYRWADRDLFDVPALYSRRVIKQKSYPRNGFGFNACYDWPADNLAMYTT